MIEIIGAPFDLCGMRLGSRLGPAALRLAGIEQRLASLDLDVIDSGDVQVATECPPEEGLRNFRPLLQTVSMLRDRVSESLGNGNMPLVLGGEHTLAIGGIGAALGRFGGERFGLLWIDAHADVNTPGSSNSGNIHGMPIAALAGDSSGTGGSADAQWRELLEALGDQNRLKLSNVSWYGLRDVDPGERARLVGAKVTMHEVDRYGVEGCWRKCADWFTDRGITELWISFDVDALDPILAPGTGTAVRGGLSYREAHFLAELIHEDLVREDCPYRLVGVDLVETNPIADTSNQTAVVAVEWIASLFGKTIL